MERFSYPRTHHLPWSPGATSDDKIIPNVKCFEGWEVVVTEKRDGENTTLYPDGYVHARSIDGTGKEYQSHIIKAWRDKCFTLNESDQKYRFCGENLFARHSIAYDNLEDYFELFGIFYDDLCIRWDTTVIFADLLELRTVPVLYRGPWDEKLIRKLCDDLDTTKVEGLVVRNVLGFSFEDFDKNIAKYVRSNHVTTDEHWTKSWTKNELK